MRSAVPATIPAAVLAIGLLLSGCGGQQDPSGYDDPKYKENLLFGCTGVQPNSDGRYEDPTLESQSYCECVFTGLEEKVPFDDAKEFEQQQAEESAGDIAVPKNIQAVYDDCKKSDES